MKESVSTSTGPRRLRIVSKCASREEFIQAFKKLVTAKTVVVPTKKPIAAGTTVDFTITLTNHDVMLAGRGTVISALAPKEGAPDVAAMAIEIEVIQGHTKSLFDELIAARDAQAVGAGGQAATAKNKPGLASPVRGKLAIPPVGASKNFSIPSVLGTNKKDYSLSAEEKQKLGVSDTAPLEPVPPAAVADDAVAVYLADESPATGEVPSIDDSWSVDDLFDGEDTTTAVAPPNMGISPLSKPLWGHIPKSDAPVRSTATWAPQPKPPAADKRPISKPPAEPSTPSSRRSATAEPSTSESSPASADGSQRPLSEPPPETPTARQPPLAPPPPDSPTLPRGSGPTPEMVVEEVARPQHRAATMMGIGDDMQAPPGAAQGAWPQAASAAPPVDDEEPTVAGVPIPAPAPYSTAAPVAQPQARERDHKKLAIFIATYLAIFVLGFVLGRSSDDSPSVSDAAKATEERTDAKAPTGDEEPVATATAPVPTAPAAAQKQSTDAGLPPPMSDAEPIAADGGEEAAGSDSEELHDAGVPVTTDQAQPLAADEGLPCTVSFTSAPSGAAVRMGRKRIGRAPGQAEVPCGEVTLTFFRQSYRTASTTVTTVPGETVEAAVQMVAAPQHSLTIATFPSGAVAYINGRKRGTTPQTASLPAGATVTVKLVKKGYKEWTSKVRLNKKTTEVRVRLKRAR